MTDVLVPWVTLWSAEKIPVEDTWLQPGPDGVSYSDTALSDYRLGVLWHREWDAQHEGDPVWSQVHARRQRQAMLDPRCQVCGTQLPRKDVPWLLSRTEHERIQGRAASRTNTPPTCEDCWQTAVDRCPHLRRADVVRLRVGSFKRWGVVGDFYHPTRRERSVWVPFNDKQILLHTIAKQMIVQLHDYQEV